MSEAIRKLGMTALTNRAVRDRIKELGLDTSHFPRVRSSDWATVYTVDRLRDIVAGSTSFSQVARAFGRRPVGSVTAHIKQRVELHGISTDHFRRTSAGRPPPNRLTADRIFVVMPEGSSRQKPHILRRAMMDAGLPLQCNECGNRGEWQGRPLTLDIDHRNGEWRDNRLENLRFVCPNCHSQTPTWRTMNHRRRRQYDSVYPRHGSNGPPDRPTNDDESR